MAEIGDMGPAAHVSLYALDLHNPDLTYMVIWKTSRPHLLQDKHFEYKTLIKVHAIEYNGTVYGNAFITVADPGF